MTSARKAKRQVKLVIKLAKPRNPLVPLARARKAGEHQKSGKALRRADKAALQKLRDG
jgi:hypothetical protein